MEVKWYPELWVRIQAFGESGSRSRPRFLMTKIRIFFKLKKYKFVKIINWNILYCKAFMKDFQAAGEAFSPPKRTSSSLKHEIS